MDEPDKIVGKKISTGNRILGIEGGATRTVALFEDGAEIKKGEFGVGNVRLLTDEQLQALFKSISERFGSADVVVAGMAGARTKKDLQRVESAMQKVWFDAICYATNDIETALEAGAGQLPDVKKCVRILIIVGTGAVVYGRSADGRTVKCDGWGHILGDRGSGYSIGISALRKVLREYDRSGIFPALGARFLRKLLMNEPDDLIEWAQKAGKNDIAELAVEVFEAGVKGDKLAKSIIDEAINEVADTAIDCARRLLKGSRSTPQFIFSGGVLLKQEYCAKRLTAKLKRAFPKAQITRLGTEGAWGAIKIARKILKEQKCITEGAKENPENVEPEKFEHTGWGSMVPTISGLPPTEVENPRSARLDKLELTKAIELFVNEEAKIPQAILKERKNIAQAIILIVNRLKRGGRLFYAGAGTSGRLGVLDASECPPTFGVEPELVQAMIAGGWRAVWEAVEGAEDDYSAGERAVIYRGITNKDVVVGISASGRAPFVWGVLNTSNRIGAATVLICTNPNLVIRKELRPDVVITIETGAEILTGSTRLKAGTATKIVLNMISTLTMARLGKVKGNLMTDLKPTNKKLRERAIRIVSKLTGCSDRTARSALEKSGWEVCTALEFARKLAQKQNSI